MRYFLLGLMTVGMVVAQETAKPQHVRVIRLQNTYANSVANLMDPVAGKTVKVAMDRQLNIITLSGPPDAVAIVENYIREIDAPQTSIEVVAYMLLGDNQATDKLPADLEPVVKQLRATFPYTKYKVLESIVARATTGKECTTRGLLPGSANAEYSLRFMRADVDSKQATAEIKLRDLQFGAHIPRGSDGKGGVATGFVGIVSTDVSLKPGQKVVIGKASFGPSAEPLFLVLSAKVAE